MPKRGWMRSCMQVPLDCLTGALYVCAMMRFCRVQETPPSKAGFFIALPEVVMINSRDLNELHPAVKRRALAFIIFSWNSRSSIG